MLNILEPLCHRSERFFYFCKMKFETANISLKIAQWDIQLTTVTNIDALFNALIQKGSDHEDVKDERIPYWAELWASSLAMAHYIAENTIITEGVRVTEIGCGLALPSIIAGKMGAEVTMTDYLNDALDFATLNWNQNLPTLKPHTHIVDWRTPDLSVSADILLASDVAYEARAFEPLLNAFRILLRPNGRIIITEPNRPVSREFFSQLDTLLSHSNTEEGYSLKHTSTFIELKGHRHTVNIYDVRKLS